MTNPWIGWNGGECPVDPRTTVEYMMANGQECVDRAMDLEWGRVIPPDDWVIVKYRVVEAAE